MAKGRKDSPEAVRVIELLQPALKSGFEAAKVIAALTTRELRKTHLEEEEKERLRGLFCSYALIADCISRINLLKVIPQSNWENVKCFLEGGTSKDVPESLRSLQPCPSQEWTRMEEQNRQERSRLRFQTAPKAWLRWELHEFQRKNKVNTSPTTQYAPASAGRVASITVPLLPAPPRIQGGSTTGTATGSCQWALKKRGGIKPHCVVRQRKKRESRFTARQR